MRRQAGRQRGSYVSRPREAGRKQTNWPRKAGTEEERQKATMPMKHWEQVCHRLVGLPHPAHLHLRGTKRAERPAGPERLAESKQTNPVRWAQWFET